MTWKQDKADLESRAVRDLIQAQRCLHVALSSLSEAIGNIVGSYHSIAYDTTQRACSEMSEAFMVIGQCQLPLIELTTLPGSDPTESQETPT